MAVISFDTDTDFCKSTCVKRRKSSFATVFALFHFLYICSLYNSWLCPPAGAGCSWHCCKGLPNICHISSGRVAAGASTIFVAFPTCPIFTTAVRASTLHVKALALNKLNNNTGSQTKLGTLHLSSYKWLKSKILKRGTDTIFAKHSTIHQQGASFRSSTCDYNL